MLEPIELKEKQDKNILIDWRAFFNGSGQFYNSAARDLFNNLCTTYYVSLLFEDCFTPEQDPELKDKIQAACHINPDAQHSGENEQHSALIFSSPPSTAPFNFQEVSNASEYLGALRSSLEERATLFMYSAYSNSPTTRLKINTLLESPSTNLYQHQLYSPTTRETPPGQCFNFTDNHHRTLLRTFFPDTPLTKEESTRQIQSRISFGASLVGVGIFFALVPVACCFPPLAVPLLITAVLALMAAVILGLTGCWTSNAECHDTAIRGFIALQP